MSGGMTQMSWRETWVHVLFLGYNKTVQRYQMENVIKEQSPCFSDAKETNNKVDKKATTITMTHHSWTEKLPTLCTDVLRDDDLNNTNELTFICCLFSTNNTCTLLSWIKAAGNSKESCGRFGSLERCKPHVHSLFSVCWSSFLYDTFPSPNVAVMRFTVSIIFVETAAFLKAYHIFKP